MIPLADIEASLNYIGFRCIYKITNLVNGKIYIGQTSDLRKRIRNYRTITIAKTAIKKAIQKYGISNFVFDIIQEISESEMLLIDNIETYWIDVYNSTNRKIGYNMIRQSITSRGHSVSEETKKKIGLKSREKFKDGKFKLGGAHTKEIIDKIVATKRKNNSFNTGKPIICLSVNGDFIGEYKSAKEAGLILKMDNSNISKAVKHGYKAYGYYWQIKKVV